MTGWRSRSIWRSTASSRLRAAHDLADGLETAIADELGASVEIETHIEPLQPHRAAGREAPPERVKAVELTLVRACRGRPHASATSTTCACARPTTAKSSISIAASILR